MDDPMSDEDPASNEMAYEIVNDNEPMDYENSIDIDFDSNPKLEDEDLLMHHVVLPRVLPQETSEKLPLVELEIMNQMIKITQLWTHRLPEKTIKLLASLTRFRIECTPETVLAAINELSPGDSFAMCVRSQNFGILIQVPPQNEEPLNEVENDIQNVIVAIFPGNLDSSQIYKYNSGIEVILFFLNIPNAIQLTC